MSLFYELRDSRSWKLENSVFKKVRYIVFQYSNNKIHAYKAFLKLCYLLLDLLWVWKEMF